jgi:hypothetical protein
MSGRRIGPRPSRSGPTNSRDLDTEGLDVSSRLTRVQLMHQRGRTCGSGPYRSGLECGRDEEQSAPVGATSGELVFEDLELPHDALVGKQGDGFKIAMTSVGAGRLAVASRAVGLAAACLEEATTPGLHPPAQRGAGGSGLLRSRRPRRGDPTGRGGRADRTRGPGHLHARIHDARHRRRARATAPRQGPP